MISDFFNSPFQKYEDNRVQLQEIEEESPNNKNSFFLESNSQNQKLRNDKFLSLPHQKQSAILTILSSQYIEDLNALQGAEYLKVKNTNDIFYGETTIFEQSRSLFRQKSKVAQGLCEIFFENGSYLMGYFDNGKLESEFIFVLENGSYIKAKPRIKKPKRSVSGFITDDSDELASDQNSSQDQKIAESDIRVEICDQKPTDLFSNLQCEINFNGIYYKGALNKGHLNGFVLQKGKDYRFEGYFVNGERKRGKFIQNRGFQYEGTFKNNKFDGLGTLKTKDGVYSGEFLNGFKDGQGQFKWNDGSSYKGDFRKDMRHGKGFFKSREGSFKGEWKNDEIEGAGYLVIGSQGVGGTWSKNSYSKPNKFF